VGGHTSLWSGGLHPQTQAWRPDNNSQSCNVSNFSFFVRSGVRARVVGGFMSVTISTCVEAVAHAAHTNLCPTHWRFTEFRIAPRRAMPRVNFPSEPLALSGLCFNEIAPLRGEGCSPVDMSTRIAYPHFCFMSRLRLQTSQIQRLIAVEDAQ